MFGFMSDGHRLVGPLNTAFIICCAAWATPQAYIGGYGGLFPEPIQFLLSATIVGALAGWAADVGFQAVSKRQFPWRAIVLAFGSFLGADLVWRFLISPQTGGDFKLAWVAMLFAQPIVAGLGFIVLAGIWMNYRPRQARHS
jgi:hypothetical protein